MKKFIVIFSALLLLSFYPQNDKTPLVPKLGYTGASKDLPRRALAKNVILMIGDGMGISQITAGLYSNGNKLNLEKFPVVGLHKSYASDNLITDSAAGATAFACGVKTYNGAVGVNPNQEPVESLLEKAEKRGMATGLVATSSIAHATPACFIAHVPDRENQEAIALDFLKTEIDPFIGGGKKYFDRRDSDERNLSMGMLVAPYTPRCFKLDNVEC